METIESDSHRDGARSAAIGLPLPWETAKVPWGPKAVGLIAFFFGPVAGALVVAISLRRMGHQQSAKKLLPLALLVAVVECAILAIWIPVALNPFVGLGAEIAFLFIVPAFMKKQFSEWQAAHPSTMPSNGWNATGLGLLGGAIFIAIYILAFVAVAAVLIILHSSKSLASHAVWTAFAGMATGFAFLYRKNRWARTIPVIVFALVVLDHARVNAPGGDLFFVRWLRGIPGDGELTIALFLGSIVAVFLIEGYLLGKWGRRDWLFSAVSLKEAFKPGSFIARIRQLRTVVDYQRLRRAAYYRLWQWDGNNELQPSPNSS